MNHSETDSDPSSRRLDSWKEIASFFDRDERTVRRWEKERSLPVHRMPGKPRGSVYAFTSELSQWLKTPNFPREELQGLAAGGESAAIGGEGLPREAHSNPPSDGAATGERRSRERRGAGRGATFWEAFRSRHELRYLAVAVAILVAITLAVVARRSWSARGAPKGDMSPRPRVMNPEAEQLYLKGVYYFNKRTPESLNQAVDYFTQAVVRDPQYAEAYVGMADCYNLLREFSLMPPDEAYPRAAAAAKRAIAIDDSLSGAHRSLAFVDFYWYWDIPDAQREFKRALELDPNSALGHHWYATFLLHMVRYPESLDEIETAQKLDPQSTSILADKGLILFYGGDADQAISLLNQLEETEPEFLSPHNYLALIYLAQGNGPQYLAESRKAAMMLHDPHSLAIVIAGEKGFARGGFHDMLAAVLKEQQTQYLDGHARAYELAETAALIGNKKLAFDYLQTAYAKRDPGMTRLRIDPLMSALHDEPLFREMLTKVGLPPLPQTR